MNRNMKRMATVLGTGLMMLPLAAADCLGPIPAGDAGPQACELDTDCPGAQQCHPTLQVCEDECTADLDCSGDRPVCNLQGGDGGPYQLEVDGIRDLCICDDTSCAEGEECSAETGTCIPSGATTCDPANNGSECPAEQPVCDEGVCKAGCDSSAEIRVECTAEELCAADGTCIPKCELNTDCTGENEICDVATGECIAACAPIGDVNDAEDEVCTPAGVYESLCIDASCVADGELCLFDETEPATYNTCVEANTVTGFCVDADGHTQDAGGPIITNIEFDAVDSAVGSCAFPLRFFADIYSETGFTTSLYSQRLKLLDAGTPGLTYSDGVGSAYHPSLRDLGNDEYLLTFYLCGDMPVPPDFAVFLSNNDGDEGNAYCFDGE